MVYKPGSIDYNEIKSAVFSNPETVTDVQREDLEQGCSAMSAFWAAAEADAFWRDMAQWPINRCILVALCVRDILRAVGRTEAEEFRTGLEVRKISEAPRSIGIGMPNAAIIENGWNAHMTVRLGDILLDPTHGQTKREWNYSPYTAAFVVNGNPQQRLKISQGFDAYPTVVNYHWSNGCHFRVAYFQLNQAVDRRTRRWKTAPDARPDRRTRLVADAVAIYKSATQRGL